MANEILKNVFREMHSKIISSIKPASVMDFLFSKDVISQDEYDKLRQVPRDEDRCRDLLSLLRGSSHPQAFIHLRLALVDLKEYWWIVDDIDKKLPSLTSQLQQLHLGNSTDGNLLQYLHQLEYICPKMIMGSAENHRLLWCLG